MPKTKWTATDGPFRTHGNKLKCHRHFNCMLSNEMKHAPRVSLVIAVLAECTCKHVRSAHYSRKKSPEHKSYVFRTYLHAVPPELLHSAVSHIRITCAHGSPTDMVMRSGHSSRVLFTMTSYCRLLTATDSLGAIVMLLVPVIAFENRIYTITERRKCPPLICQPLYCHSHR